VDSAFQAKYLTIARMLWNASEGDPSGIPGDYAEHLNHTYVDGDISMVSLLPKFESFSELEDVDIEEAIEMLGKVSPGDWPNVEDIEGVSIEELLKVYETDASEFPEYEFVEDNLGTAEKVEKVLIEVISSVFGDKVSNVRSEKGYFPNPKNNFLQEEDGTFAGTFDYEGHKYIFEVAPAENGWICTYRAHWDTLEKLPPKHDEDDNDKTDYERKIRHRGWR
jgi:hypothetical protein